MIPARRVPRFASPAPSLTADDLAFARSAWAAVRGVPTGLVTATPVPPFGLVVRAPGHVRHFASLDQLARACAALATRKLSGASVEPDRSPERLAQLEACLAACEAWLSQHDSTAPDGR